MWPTGVSVLVPRASFPYSSPSYESTAGKRDRDSESWSDTVGKNRLNLSNEEGIAYIPTFVDVSKTKAKSLKFAQF